MRNDSDPHDQEHRLSNGKESDAGGRVIDATRRSVLKATGVGIGGVALGSLTGSAAAAAPPALHTDGRWIRDADDDDVKLRGVAAADPGFYSRFHPKSAQDVFGWAMDSSRGWHPNVIRIPCTQDSVTHFGVNTFVQDHVRPIVDLAAQRGVYALVDFHLVRPYTDAATDSSSTNYSQYPDQVMNTFWNAAAPEFANDQHVILEMFNEPTEPAHWSDDQAAWNEWQSAAQPWVDAIQNHAPNRPLVVGSPRWTSMPHMAPSQPFSGSNLIYAGHIYPDNGQPSSFDSTYGQPANDVPVYITEFGWDPDSSSVDQGTTSGWGQPFRNWVEGYQNMGWTAWCFDDSWAPTIFNSPNAGANEPWTLKDGAEQQGGYVKQWLDDTVGNGGGGNDTTPPTAPSNLSSPSHSQTSVDLDWDAATDSGGSGLGYYEVLVDGSVSEQVSSGSTSTTVTGLSTDTTYSIAVRAVDGAGNVSASSNSISVTTDSGSGNGGTTDYVAETTPSSTTAGVGESVSFPVEDTSDGDHWITGLQWEFGDGTTGQGWWVTHSWDSAGTYTVSLIATNSAGETSTYQVDITVS